MTIQSHLGQYRRAPALTLRLDPSVCVELHAVAKRDSDQPDWTGSVCLVDGVRVKIDIWTDMETQSGNQGYAKIQFFPVWPPKLVP